MNDPQKNVIFFVVLVALLLGLFWLSSSIPREIQNNNISIDPAIASNPEFVEGKRIFYEQKCDQCHKLNGFGGAKGPDLTTVKKNLQQKLSRYDEKLKALQKDYSEEYHKYESIFQKILKAEGDERIRLWLFEHIRQPYFDNPETQMPLFSLSEKEINALVFFLMENSSPLE